MADDDLSGSVLDGRYKVIEPIAEGAMGSVYRGERLRLGRAVAIKIMHDALPDELSSRQRFEREAKLMALLEHPHCVSVIDFGIHDDKPFLVMDLVRGTSLAELMEKTGRFEIARACDIVRQVLSGLGHAHELGIVHRDIKPANIMLSSKTGLGEQVRILDFGLARLTDTGTKLTTGIVVGTPNYMAPEQCRGSDVDGRSDLYACGVLLFEMLTGRKPFVADDPIQVVRKHLQEPPPKLADVEPGVAFGELEAVVAKALAKNPADRFESAEQMSAAIEAAVARRSVPATPAELFARAVPQTGSSPPPGQVATPSGWAVPPGMADTAPGGPDGPGTMTDAQASAYVPGSAPVAAPHAQIPSAPIVAPIAHAPSAPAQAAPGGVSDLSAILPSPDVEPAADPSLSIPVAPPAPPATDGTPGRTGTAIALGAVPAPHGTSPSGPTGSPPHSAVPRASGMPSLPFTRRQLAIGGGGLLGLIILIAIFAGHGSSKHATSPTNPATTRPSKPAPTDDQVQPLIDQANQLAASDDLEGAHELLRKALRDYPDNPKLAFTAGRICFWKLWWTEGIDHFRDAIRLDPSYRSDPDLIKTVLRGFITTPDIDDRIESFLREDLGTAAVPYLEETAKDHPNAGIRARAKSELRRIH